MDTLIDIAPALAIAVVAVGVFGYVVALALAAFHPGGQAGQDALAARLRAWFAAAPAQNLGLPSAAISAFAIVTLLLRAFPPPASSANGSLAFKAFGLEFSGPSGPITLWLMCFLVFVVALKLLR
jgi:hypothetical protein